MLTRVLAFFSLTVLVSAGRSPNADYIEELVKANAFGPYISDNVVEDATLDLRDLVRKYNYPFEEYNVITEDGYVLGLHRIPHGRDRNNSPGNKTVIFLMHGLLSSSAENVIMGPGSGLAYILAEEGYDVWMGNARGTHFSRRNLLLNPDDRSNPAFWRFSWDDIGTKDLPAMIDFALAHTKQEKMHYVGFSQGTTSFWVMTSLKPEYNKKILSMQAMAPVAYMANNNIGLFKALAPYSQQFNDLLSLIGINEMFPRSEIITAIGQLFCSDGKPTQFLCAEFLYVIAGKNPEQLNMTMLPVLLGHLPGGAATRQLTHYLQLIHGKEFTRYDHGVIGNLVEYGSMTPPRYDLSRIDAPVFLHYSQADPLAEVPDVERLHSELGNVLGKYRIEQPTFSHIDFVWGIDAKKLVFDRLIQAVRSMDV
ncbi:lipase 1-like [Danaus plexippus]|uniref:lipase 1-like n=1 Tax=Danaus plexippus TaxID=13037 RepID=UPI002AB0ADC9|nr:lipase 1-like [Danaus plexippus]